VWAPLESLARAVADSPVSDPTAQSATPQATAAALPPLLPPGLRRRSRGFSVGPTELKDVAEPIPNSSCTANCIQQRIHSIERSRGCWARPASAAHHVGLSHQERSRVAKPPSDGRLRSLTHKRLTIAFETLAGCGDPTGTPQNGDHKMPTRRTQQLYANPTCRNCPMYDIVYKKNIIFY